MSSMEAFTAATVNQAADNLFRQLKVLEIVDEASSAFVQTSEVREAHCRELMMCLESVSHANSYFAYRTQENSMKALASRSASTSSSIRQRTIERVTTGIQEAIQEMREDLRQMEALIEHAAILPRSSMTAEDARRLDLHIAAHRQHLLKKQALLEVLTGVSAAQSLPESKQEEWLQAWKEVPAIKETEKQEMDALSDIFGKW